MDFKVGLVIVAVGHCMLHFFDSFFKSCAHYPYIKFLEGTGLSIKFFNIKWTTTAFNRSLFRLGNIYSSSKFLETWFTLGLVASLVLLPIAIVILFYSFIQNFSHSNNDIILSPVIPGINLPASEIVFYSLTLVICSIIHEFGHALAAVKEDIQISNVGLNIFFILPIAYVNLNSENLRGVEPWKRLRILTAGIWHNLVLSLFCYLVYLCLPSLLGSVFHIGKAVALYDATKMSPLLGMKGLEIGDQIRKINDCEVQTEELWIKCLQHVRDKNGICFKSDTVRDLDETSTLKYTANGFIECCDESKKSNVCFEFLDIDSGVLELPSHVCLPVRSMLNSSDHYCSKFEPKCPVNSHCFVPLLNETRLFKIEVINKPMVIYMGLADDFLRTLRVSSYVPRLFFNTPLFAETIKKMLEYIIIISLGLAIINILPCFFMDGQHIINTLLYVLLSRSFDGDKLILISSMICLVFTMLLIAHCVLAILPLIF